LQFTHQSRLLHRSATLAEPGAGEAGAGAPAPDRRAAELLADAQRTLRKAKVLASGGFPEETPVLLANVLQKAAAARMAERSELPTGASSASDTDIRRLVERGEFPQEALAILDASQPSAGAPTADSVNALVTAAEQVLAAAGRDIVAGPSLRAA
jgi:hypothetical protein